MCRNKRIMLQSQNLVLYLTIMLKHYSSQITVYCTPISVKKLYVSYHVMECCPFFVLLSSSL